MTASISTQATRPPCPRWPQPVLAAEHGLPSLVMVLAALALLDLERADAAGLPWYLSPRRAAALLGATSDSFGTETQVLSAWHQAGGPPLIELERACWQVYKGERTTLPAGTGKRLAAWKALVPAAYDPGRLAETFRRVLAGELVVALKAPPKKARSSSKAKGAEDAPLLEQTPPSLRVESRPGESSADAGARQKTQAKSRPKKKAKGSQAISALPARFLAIDVETTGTGKEDRVWELAIAVFEGGQLTKVHVKRFDPGKKLHWSAVNVTGVTWAELKGEPRIEESIAKIHRFLEGEVVVAHNLGFDRRMLGYEFERAGLSWPDCEEVCTVKMAKPVMKRFGKKSKLDVCCEHFGIQLDNHHQAADDARAAGELLVKLMEAT